MSGIPLPSSTADNMADAMTDAVPTIQQQPPQAPQAPPPVEQPHYATFEEVQAHMTRLQNLNDQLIIANNFHVKTKKELEQAISNLIVTRNAPNIKVNKPKEFTGIRAESYSFIAQCKLVFSASPAMYASSEGCIAYVASFLRQDAFKWFEATISRPERTFENFTEFTEFFFATFGENDSITEEAALDALATLTQSKSCQAYTNKFLSLIVRTRYDEYARMVQYKRGLKPEIRQHLLGIKPAASFAELSQQAITFDDQLFSLKKKKGFSTVYHSTSSSSHATPMDIDAFQASPAKFSNRPPTLDDAERKRRRELNLCRYCGSSQCPGTSDVQKCSVLLAKNARGAGKA
jgi:hypothetical protein